MFEFIWDAIDREMDEGAKATVPVRPGAAPAPMQFKVVTLEQRYERLRLTSMAMWELMKHRLNVTDEDLAAEIQTLVAEANKKGENARGGKITQCPACHRTVLSSAATCVYCGVKLPPTSGFAGT
jgi:hypothetical protein